MRQSRYIGQFKVVRPAFEKSQQEAISWLADAHATAEAVAGFPSGRHDLTPAYFEKLIARFGCSPERIAFRGHELIDFTHKTWSEMRVFDLQKNPTGQPMEARQRVYDELVRNKCDLLFPAESSFGNDLIHVSCTGYLSPSPLQRLVAERGFGGSTRVLHAYHMGCYAALPATRLASALVGQQWDDNNSGSFLSADVVHTELCTLHFNPLEHSPEQLVVQSLFADGFIRYKVANQPAASGRSFKILAMNEVQIPESSQAMTWLPVSWGMAMTLSRDVPTLISGALKEFIDRLISSAGLKAAEVLPRLVYAVHPGGPKIIDHIQQLLEIREEKIQESRNVLRKFGNMSSATLPHLWNEILENSACYRTGDLVLSLAFGPGLTIAGSLFEVVGSET
ncbi:hypothetical protein EBU99_00895 [bacterium]|nr:hypothetical protein [bacterium]